jgi:hypothetical protein
MKQIFVVFILLPLLTRAQADSTVVYQQQYLINGLDKTSLFNTTINFIKDNREKFFLLTGYGKLKVNSEIDTSGYGQYTTLGNTIKSPCIFIYMAGTTDLVKGEMVFNVNNDTAVLQLKNVHYYKYEMQNGKPVETKEGYYKDLNMCKHCNVSGIRVAETVNRGFVNLSLSYHQYLKKKLKE